MAIVLSACASGRRDAVTPEYFTAGCKPFQRLEELAGDDLYRAQAPLPCLGAYRSVQQRPGQDPKTAVAVAISGGGYRAANFAFGVLLGLEQVKAKSGVPLLQEVDYFSTVSGGGIAAGVYISSLFRHNFDAGRSRTFSLETAKEGLAEAIRKNLHRYLWGAILPGRGRNEELHNRLDRLVQNKNGRSLTLGDVFVPSCQSLSDRPCDAVPRLPYWFANATVAANGAIFPFTPDILRHHGVTGYRHRSDVELSPYDMPLSAGMTASAAFPGGIPPLTLCVKGKCGRMAQSTSDKKELQLMDGGAADNLGVLTALAVLAQDEAKKKVLIVVDAYVGTEGPFQLGGRLSTIAVLRRTTSISLDSWRGRHKHVVTSMARGLSNPGDEWQVVFLSFDDLEADNHDLHKAVREVSTSLNISDKQQKKLWEAGRAAVNIKNHTLCRIFSCPG